MPATRSSDPEPPKTHILDFFYDDDDGCAFTARINDRRFHIIVDSEKLKTYNGNESGFLAEYLEKLRLLRANDRAEESGGQEAMGATKESSQSEDGDSGVDVSANEEKDKDAAVKKTQELLSSCDSDPALDLQNWILRGFGDEVPSHPDDEPSSKEKLSIQDWYEVPTRYYEVNLSADEDNLEPARVNSQSHFQQRVDDLLPHLPLPKKLRSLPIPWIPASQVTVLAEHDDPPPIHPSLVRTTPMPGEGEKTYFFKPVDPSQPQPPKREIEILHRIQSRGIAEEVRAPRIEALVGWRDSEVEAMGYLLSVIEKPVPLTKLLDSEVDESKRERWARDAKRVVKVLHEHGIVWGDAKADNFLVDGEERLWVIDFGGSYTEGWVDGELIETVEGDDMALEKIVNGLEDPNGMTVDFNEGASGGSGQGQGKRKREEENADGDGCEEAGEAGRKRVKA